MKIERRRSTSRRSVSRRTTAFTGPRSKVFSMAEGEEDESGDHGDGSNYSASFSLAGEL